MGFFDGLRKDKKQAEPVQQEQRVQEDTVEDEIAIEHIEVVERDPHSSTVPEPQPVESRPEIEPTPIHSYRDKKPVKHVVGQTKIMAIINQKGGVGKSTTAINLSAALGELGKQVLLVDLDPQGNSSSGLGVEKSQVQNCIYDVLLNDVPVEEVIIPDVCEGLDLVPATINLAGAEVELVSEMARENRLKDAIGALRGKYDYIFIDCPPSLGLLTVNALVAADKLLIPIQCEFYALEGVTKLLDSMKRVKTRLNPTLDIYCLLYTSLGPPEKWFSSNLRTSATVISEPSPHFILTMTLVTALFSSRMFDPELSAMHILSLIHISSGGTPCPSWRRTA